MASSIIHMAIASEINKIAKKDETKILIGTIAPDISKLINEDRNKSHFIDLNKEEDIPSLDLFLQKYKKSLSNDFVLGYYIHLYVDYLWFKYFITEITDYNLITKLDGTIVKLNDNMLCQYIYNDYTNLNNQLLDIYDLNCKIFYNEPPKFEEIITEIPMNKINVIINQAGNILYNTTKRKEFIFNIENVKKFIDFSTKIILSNLREMGIIK